jgi:S-(hydroxymethyl)glutathione dehydrogenase/alcohol dehydrogenase
VIAVDVSEAKLGTAKKLGATHLVDASQGDPVMKIRELTNGGVDYSFEAIGLKLTTEQAFDCLGTGGTATLIGMVPLGQKVELDARHLLFGERKMQGSIMGSNRFRVDMPQYIEFYRQGRLKLDEMITTRMALEDVNEAFRAMKAGEVARQVIMFN